MEKGALFFLGVFFLAFASSAPCEPTISLLNQDPYPAVPGEYAKLVFNVEDLDVDDCSDITFELLGDYPVKFNPGESPEKTFERVDYLRDFESSIMIPYKVIIDPDALNGPNSIEVRFQSRGGAAILKTFDLEVKNTRAEFEIYVKDYDRETNSLTLEVLNIADSDIEALTIEILNQETIGIKGPSRVIVGDLDSNEYTTAEFEATPKEGWFEVKLIYSDAVNVRRESLKRVYFGPEYFTGRKAEQSTTPLTTYLFWIAVIIGLVYWFLRRRKKKKERMKGKHHHK